MIDWSGDPLFGTNTKLVSATTLQFWSRIVGCAVACTPQRPAKPGLIFFYNWAEELVDTSYLHNHART